MSQRTEICKTRKNAGLSCNGCQYGDDCEEKKQKETADGIPEDIKPGTKQAKIYGLLKDGQTAKEIIATKEFASESVYIVARKHFPDAITKKGNARVRLKKAAGKVIDKENYFGKPEQLPKEKAPKEKVPETDERILIEKMIRDGEKLQEKCKTITVILKDTKAALEEGKIIETYNKLQKMIEYMEVEK